MGETTRVAVGEQGKTYVPDRNRKTILLKRSSQLWASE